MSAVSFTIRRPTPVSRATSPGPESDPGSSFKVPPLPRHLNDPTPPLGSPLARSAASTPQNDLTPVDSSDEDSAVEDELVTGFDKFGVQRLNGDKKANKPLVIPALKNKDWKEVARKRRGGGHYVPPSAAAQTGADGSVGGLGTRDTINSGPVLSGLQVKAKAISDGAEKETVDLPEEDIKMEIEQDTEDQMALRALLAEASGGIHEEQGIHIIPAPISEADALKQDVEELPDVASLEDYARVPVAQFGAALLRGMGWKEGTAATRKAGKGRVEPYLPSARPALLGLGAKEQEVYDDGSKKNGKIKRPDRRYVPVTKQDRTDSSSLRERSRSPRRAQPPASRHGSRSPDYYTNRNDGNGDTSQRRYVSREGERDKRRGDDRERRRDGGRREDRDSGRRPEDRDRWPTDDPKRKRERSTDSSRRRRDY